MKKDKKPLTADKQKHLCQCLNKDCNNLFDYRDRIKFEGDEEHYAPCQGRCPRCGRTEFTFLGIDNRFIQPITWNFIDMDWNAHGKRTK